MCHLNLIIYSIHRFTTQFPKQRIKVCTTMISGRAVPRKPLSFSCHANHASCNTTTPLVSPNMASPILNECECCREGTKVHQIEANTRGTNQSGYEKTPMCAQCSSKSYGHTRSTANSAQASSLGHGNNNVWSVVQRQQKHPQQACLQPS